MPQFIIILIKINLVLLLFAAAYYLILRRLTFYTINRLFLVFGIVFSSLYPFINLTDFFHRQQQINENVVAFVPKLNQQVNNLVPSNFIALHWQILTILFYVGAALMALRLFVQFFSLYKMHKKSAPGSLANYPVRILTEPVSPFSFWQTVYINPSLHQESELKTILAHEQIHVKEWHSLDIILAELSVVFYWFNPGVWLMKKAVKENLEFITDQKILNKGIDKKTYQYSLLDVGNLVPAAAIVNNFNISDLKKRIRMMNVKRSSKLTLSRYLLVTPVLLISTLAFTVSKKDIKKHLIPFRQVLVSNHIISPPKAIIESKKKTNKPKSVAVRLTKSTDSTKTVKLLIKSFFITADSLNSPAIEMLRELSESKVLNGGTVIGLKRKNSSEMVIYKSDSVVTEGNLNKIENFTMQLRGEPILSEGANLSNVVVVRGYPTKEGKLRDTSYTQEFSYSLNGKKLSKEELAKLNPDAIQKIRVQGRALKTTGIEIHTKDQ